MKQIKYTLCLFIILLLAINSSTLHKPDHVKKRDNLSNNDRSKIKRKVDKSKKQIEEADEIRNDEKSNFQNNESNIENEIGNYSQEVPNNEFSPLNTDFYNGIYSEDKAKFFASFARAAKCYEKPTKAFFRGHRFYSAQTVMRNNVYPYKTFIHVNEDLNRVVISIGGPRNLSPTFYNSLYAEDFNWIAQHKILLEKEFSEVYYIHIRNFLIKKITKLKFSGFLFPEYIFNGHGIGASLAIYAAFDLAKSGIISYRVKKPIVYSFGALRIGDATLATQVNKFVDVWRITKQNDFLTRAPVCYYCDKNKRWDCKADYFYQYQKYLGKDMKNLQLESEENKIIPEYVQLDDRPNNENVNSGDSELSRNVFERNEKPYKYYSQFYNSAFNPQAKYYNNFQSKKDDMFYLYFNVVPDISKYKTPEYTKAPTFTPYQNFENYEEENANKLINPKIVEDINEYNNPTSILDADDLARDIGKNAKKQEEKTKVSEAKTDKKTDLPADKAEVKSADKADDKTADKADKKSRKRAQKVTTSNIVKKYRGFVPEFIDAKRNKRDYRISLEGVKHKNRNMRLIQLMKPAITYTSNSSLADLNKYWSNYLYFTPPIGRQIYYTHDGKYSQCKRTYFGASTCELENLLPKYFYSTSGHNNYLGVDFGDC